MLTFNTWSTGLWPNSHHLNRRKPVGSGKYVFDYQFTDLGKELSLGTFCHENGHMLCDFPDLYGTGPQPKGVRLYCLMGLGCTIDPKNPINICAYLKMKAGWSDVSVEASIGQFTLASAGNQFMIYRVTIGYGALLLSPLNGRSLKSAALEFYTQVCQSPKKWAHFYLNFASSTWQMQKDSLYSNSSVLGGGALFHYKFFEGLIAETEIGLSGEIGLSARWLDGDVRSLLDDETTKAKYLAVFPTEKSFFTGLEGGLTLNFGQVIGALQAYYLLNKKNEPIVGLSRLQISVGLSVRGDILRGTLQPK